MDLKESHSDPRKQLHSVLERVFPERNIIDRIFTRVKDAYSGSQKEFLIKFAERFLLGYHGWIFRLDCQTHSGPRKDFSLGLLKEFSLRILDGISYLWSYLRPFTRVSVTALGRPGRTQCSAINCVCTLI